MSAIVQKEGSSELVLDRYRLGRVLGTGGFGTVRAARDERLQRDVAIKILQRDRVDFARFEREARAAARLTHAAIVLLYEAAVDEHSAYLVSELVRGRTLRAELDAGRLSDRGVIEIALAVCEALHHAHAQGVVHCDITPANILVPARASSAGTAAKLTDFGVARVLGDGGLTGTAEIVGTDAYMAPEQARGEAATAATDSYALALVIYEALSGVNPAARRPPRRMPPLRRQRREIDPVLAAAVDRALDADPQARGTLGELAQALAAALARADDRPGVIMRTGWLGRPTDAHDPAPEPGARWDQPRAPAAGPQAGGTVRALPRLAARATWLRYALAALSAAIVTWWLSLHLLAHAPLAPSVAALLAAAAALTLPRLGLGAGALTLTVLAVTQGRPGAALLVSLVVLQVAVTLPRTGRDWTLPAGAVLLGALSLAGAWPAVAARAGVGAWRRAALGAAGFVWVSAAGAFTGVSLYAPERPPFPPVVVWRESLEVTLHDVLIPLLHSGLPAGAAVWALAAALAPVLITGRSHARDVLVAGVWSAATLWGTGLCIRLQAGAQRTPTLRGALLGALLAAAVVLVPREGPAPARGSMGGWRGRVDSGRAP